MTLTLNRRPDHNYIPGPNAELIRAQAIRVIIGSVPAQVHAELRLAVKAGYLGHLTRDGLKSAIFFHPDHENGAIELQKNEAAYAVKCIAGVIYKKSVSELMDEALARLID